MTKISVFIESKNGEVLGEVISFKDRISIGASEECSLCLKNIKLADLESEIYFLNNECWLQVGKEGAPVFFMGKQHRSIKITQSSQLQFRDYVLKVILDSIPEFESEATKIVNQTMSDSSEKTRLVQATDLALEIDLSAPKTVDSESTRIVTDFEHTRIVAPQEATRIAPLDEATRIAPLDEATRIVTKASRPNPLYDESTLTNTRIEISKNNRQHHLLAEESGTSDPFKTFLNKQDFSRVKIYIEDVLNRFQIKERIFPIFGIIFIAIAVFMLAARDHTAPSSSSNTKIATTEIKQTDKSIASIKPQTAPNESPAAGNTSTQTKEGYLNEMSTLFE